jgi:hypothetical protein
MFMLPEYFNFTHEKVNCTFDVLVNLIYIFT